MIAANVRRMAHTMTVTLAAAACLAGHTLTAHAQPPWFDIAVSDQAACAQGFASDGNRYLVAVNQSGLTNAVQFLSSSGALEERLPVPESAGMPAAVAFGGGRFLMAWVSSDDEIRGQLVSPAGALVGNVFTISTQPTAVADIGTCQIASDGTDFLVVWEDTRNSMGGDPDIYGRIVASSGAMTGAEIPVALDNEPGIGGDNDDRHPSVAFGGSRYLVAFTAERRSGFYDGEDVYGQFVSATGALEGGNFVIDENDMPSPNPTATVFDGEDFVVLFHDSVRLDTAEEWDLFARLVGTNGVVDSERHALAVSAASESLPACAFDGTRFLVTSSQGTPAPYTEEEWLDPESVIRGRYFDASLKPASPWFALCEPFGENEIPLATTLLPAAGGGFFIGLQTVSTNVAPLHVYGAAVGPVYPLTVINGTGGGLYTNGALITVRADAPADGQSFASWSGDTGPLADAGAASTSLVMPAQGVSVAATYSADPGFSTAVLSGAWNLQALGAEQVDTLTFFADAGFFQMASNGVFSGTGNSTNHVWSEEWVQTGSIRYLGDGLVRAQGQLNGDPEDTWDEVRSINSSYDFIYTAGTSEAGAAPESVLDEVTVSALVKSPAASGLSDLEGEWRYVSFFSAALPLWERSVDRIAIETDGACSGWLIDSLGSTGFEQDQLIPTDQPGRFVFAEEEAQDFVLNASKDILFNSGYYNDEAPSEYSAKILLKKGSSYQPADLVGKWRWHSLYYDLTAPADGRPLRYAAAEFTVDAAGSFSGTLVEWFGESVPFTGSASVDANGQVSFCVDNYGKLAYFLNAGKSAMAGCYTLDEVEICFAVALKVPTTDTARFQLTVESGDGDGVFLEGAPVPIKAAEPPFGKVFDRWTGATQVVANAWSSTTTVTVPAQAVAVTATYRYADGASGDDFEDGVRDPLKWGSDLSLEGSEARLLETNGRLEFRKAAGQAGYGVLRPWLESAGSFTQNWAVSVDVHLAELPLSEEGAFANVNLCVANPQDTNRVSGIPIGDSLAIALDLYRADGVNHRGCECTSRVNNEERPTAPNYGYAPTEALTVRLQIAFDAASKVLSASYDGVALGSIDVDAAGSNWEMDSSDTFAIAIVASSSPLTLAIGEGQAYADSFVALGLTHTPSATQGTPVPIPHSWLIENGLASGSNYEEAAFADADSDGHAAWQEYVTGTSPTNQNSVFRAFIRVENSSPVVTWDPDLGDARRYTVEGRAALTSGTWQPADGSHRLFRVRTEMP